jgi:hypothetical protein
MAPQPPWETISTASFFYEPECWLTCGGYCCGTRGPAFKFKLMPQDAESIIYFGDEYDWAKAHGLAPDPEVMHTREFTFDFGAAEPLRFVVVRCEYQGRCVGCLRSPLMCRLYPFAPIFEPDGRLTAVYPASIFDLTFLARQEQSPCTVWHRKRDQQLQDWQTSPALDLLRHPRLMFAFAAYKCFADHYLERLSAATAMTALQGQAFWQRWELLYLSKRLVDAPAVKAAIFATYQKFCESHGRFMG